MVAQFSLSIRFLGVFLFLFIDIYYVITDSNLLFYRVNVASLLVVVLTGRMEYLTDILRLLLQRLIDKSMASKHPQLMLRRTETVVEKMLTNWLALCMYSYLKVLSYILIYEHYWP